MTADDVLGRITLALDTSGIPYMLTGSFASAFHGMPRATVDIDLVIAPNADQLRQFVRSLPDSEYYVDLAAALEAFHRRSLFNVIDLETGWKIDLIVRKERAFSRHEFDRRAEIDLHGRRIAIATAEDVILAKLEWAKSGGSGRQIEDVVGVLKICTDLDRVYLEYWIAQLEIDSQWQTALSLAGIA